MKAHHSARVRDYLRRKTPSAFVDARRRQRSRRDRVGGLPSWVDSDTVHAVGTELLGRTPDTFAFADLSGYKEESAALIWARLANTRQRTFFVKRSFRGSDHYPAIKDFPGAVGPPEEWLYMQDAGRLRPYVPMIYTLIELDDVEVHYFLEDISRSNGFRSAVVPQDIPRLIHHLLDMQEALREWVTELPDGTATRYDDHFAAKLVDYCFDSLDAFVGVTGDKPTIEFLRRWGEISDAYLGSNPGEPMDGVHGDYRPEHLFVAPGRGRSMKAVDWEYAGLGWVHNDLASLLKKTNPEVMTSAMRLVAAHDRRFSLDEHLAMLHRFRLERCILDAALVTRQRIAKSEHPWVSSEHFYRAYDAASRLGS